MRNSDRGPFLRKLFIPEARFEAIAVEALCEQRLMPEKPEAIRIERFIEKRWGFPEHYEELPEDVLGRAVFSSEGLERIEINRSFEADTSVPGRRRLRSTLAHEAAHGIVHTPLWQEVLGAGRQELLLPELECEFSSIGSTGFNCRASVITDNQTARTEWWEFQANRLMSCLLLPMRLVLQIAERHRASIEAEFERNPYTDWRKVPSFPQIFPCVRLIQEVADIFDVNPRMVGIRLDPWFAEVRKGQGQLAL
jgi:hypothetical protein